MSPPSDFCNELEAAAPLPQCFDQLERRVGGDHALEGPVLIRPLIENDLAGGDS